MPMSSASQGLQRLRAGPARLPLAGVTGAGQDTGCQGIFKAVNCLERTGDPCDSCRQLPQGDLRGASGSSGSVTPDSR
ncbi:MAG: hypothetical protein MZU79_09155 [Anaerotruncus sp.]|nr:hypothetical protein [Anaerotruncus sp.]